LKPQDSISRVKTKVRHDIGNPGPNQDTTTCIVADRWGNVVVATPSGWGDKGEIGDTGIRLGCRLISFRSGPDNEKHPNVVKPGKRPAITLTPTLVVKDGKPVIAVSVERGDFHRSVKAHGAG